MKKLFILITLLPVLCIGQRAPQLKHAHHTFSLQGDSLTVFQEAEFFSIVDWYASSDTVNFLNNTITMAIYYNPEPHTGNFEYTSMTKDTFGINGLSLGSHTLIINSYEYGDSIDQNFVGYTFYTLRDSDTSYFQVLSDKTYYLSESPINLYPNPANDWVHLQGLKQEDGWLELTISDLKGREIRRGKVSSENPKLWLGDLPRGNYTLRLAELLFTQKLTIQ